MEKPPLGLMPRYVHEARRSQDILDAMQRHLNAEKLIPAEWVTELFNIKSVVDSSRKGKGKT